MSQIRLLPVLLIAAGGLFFIKVTHIVANYGEVLSSSGPAVAQEAPAKNAGDGAEASETKINDTTSEGDAARKNSRDSSENQEPPSLVDGMKVDTSGSSRSELAILERLAKRRDELGKREQEIEMRDALLKAAEKRLQERVDELKKLENSIRLASRKRDEQQQEDLGKLVAMYESMKAKQAARIFEVLEQDVLLDIVKIMKPRKVAAIMGQMNANAAGALSLSIAKGKSLEEQVKNTQLENLPQIGN
jgi:flagellar motility protein MotE (MotC chaperone)